ncbi:MAG: hypothetical protein QOG31_1034 [Thermoplasmata archaeon]|jgi:DNA-binding transcriptional ArsR family regulator|nr:hypothetical protein [Thermoplasmata archaeon]
MIYIRSSANGGCLRGTPRWGALLLLFLLPLAAPLASATQLDARFDVQGDALFHGRSDAHAAWSGSVQDARLGHGADGLFWVRGTALLLNYTFLDSKQAASSPTGYGRNVVLLSQSAFPLGRVEGPLAVVAGTPESSLRLLPAEDATVPLAEGFSLTPARSLHDQLGTSDDAQPIREGAAFYPRVGGMLGGAPLQVAGLAFEGRLVATGLLLALPGGPLDTRWTTQGPEVANVGWDRIRTTHVLVVEGTLQSATALAPDHWATAVRGVAGDLDGDLVLQNSAGQGTLNGTPLPDGIHLFQAAGRFHVAAAYGVGRGDWQVAGDPRFAAVNAVPLAGTRPGWGVGLAAAGGLGLLALLAKALSKALPAIRGRHDADPMAGAKRQRILTLVSENPGIGQRGLAEQAEASRATVRHHLRILLHAGIVSEHAARGQRVYTLNSESYGFPVGAGSAAQALALLRNPIRSQLFQALRDHPGLDLASLREVWRPTGAAQPDPNVLAYHLGRLATGGLVERATVEGRTVWRAAFDPGDTRDHQRKAFLARNNLAHLASVLRPEPLPLADLQARLARVGRRVTARDLEAQLALLAAVGYARGGADGWAAIAPAG